MTALALALAVALSGAPSASANSKAAFEQLKKLEGNWKAGAKEGTAFLTFRVVADGTAVLETMTGVDKTAITVMATYYLEDGELVVSHFSADGVAQLRASASNARAVRFEAPRKAGGQGLSVMLKDADNLTREWTPGSGKAKTSLDFRREYVDTLK